MSLKEHFRIHVQVQFSAAHHLRGYEGVCANTHGHTWAVDVYAECEKLNQIGITVDFNEVKTILLKILSELDHKDLNSLPMFRLENPSSENIAKYIYHNLKTQVSFQEIRSFKVTVNEGSGFGVTYWQD